MTPNFHIDKFFHQVQHDVTISTNNPVVEGPATMKTLEPAVCTILPTRLKALQECSKVTGIPLQKLFNEALYNYCHDVVPVKIRYAKC